MINIEELIYEKLKILKKEHGLDEVTRIEKQNNCLRIYFSLDYLYIKKNNLKYNDMIYHICLDNMSECYLIDNAKINIKLDMNRCLDLLDENDEFYTTCEYCGGKLYTNFICSECGCETECK